MNHKNIVFLALKSKYNMEKQIYIDNVLKI